MRTICTVHVSIEVLEKGIERKRTINFSMDFHLAGRSFHIAKGKFNSIEKNLLYSNKMLFVFLIEQMLDTQSCACIVSYEFLSGSTISKDLQYFNSLKNRIPKVVEMMTTFIQNIVDSLDFKINLSTVYLTGYSLGGHLAGMVGRSLKEIYNGDMVPAIWCKKLTSYILSIYSLYYELNKHNIE